MTRQALSTLRRLNKLGREWEFRHEGTVCNGFPIIIWFSIDEADPEVGYFHDSINDYELTTLTGSPALWLKVSKKDMDNLLTSAMEAVVQEAKENFNEQD